MKRFPVTALRSVDLDVPDLAAAERFYTQVWGLEVAHRAGGALYFHATGDDHHVLALHAADAPALRSMTFRAQTPGALADIAAAVPGAGGRVIDPPGPVDWVAGGHGVTIADPRGRVIRVVHGDERRRPDAPVRDRPTRLSHINFNSTATDADAAFFEATLGFSLSDRSKMMAFVRCNADHHSVVIADAPVDGLNHVAFLMPDLEGVMLGSGRMVDHGFPIAWGVGRHGPGNNVFAYFIDPFGIVIEYTGDVLQVDDSYVVRGPEGWTWPPGRIDHWGIAPPKGDALKHAQLAIPCRPAA